MRAKPPTPRRGLLKVAALACVVGTSVAVAGCAGGGAAATTPTSTPSSSTTETISITTPTTTTTTGVDGTATGTPGSRTLAVMVTGSSVNPAPSTVELPVGQTLVLTITSDHADEVHAHGFEVEKEVAAGGSVTFVLTGKDAGVYEVEMHDPALTLMKIAVS